MNLKIEAHALAKKIRTALTTIAARRASLESTQRQQAEVQRTIDDAVAKGAIDDEQSVSLIANQNARLLLFPTRIKQIEGELAQGETALVDYLVAANAQLARAASATEKALHAQITKALAPLISEGHRVEALAQQAVRFCDANITAHNANWGFAQHEVQQYQGNHESIVPLAEVAAAKLEAVTIE